MLLLLMYYCNICNDVGWKNYKNNINKKHVICSNCKDLFMISTTNIKKIYKLTEEELDSLELFYVIIWSCANPGKKYMIEEIEKAVIDKYEQMTDSNNLTKQDKRRYKVFESVYMNQPVIVSRYSMLKESMDTLFCKYERKYVNRFRSRIELLLKYYSKKINMSENDCIYELCCKLDELIEEYEQKYKQSKSLVKRLI
jgi:hypothetical protein